jgi:hypothetical protein
MTRGKGLVALFLVVGFWVAAAQPREINGAGKRLEAVLDDMNVERLWLAGEPISWRTGQLDPRGHQEATHCSAFAAAACARLGVYILRPPDHSQNLLANAQNLWLKSAGARLGWRPVPTWLEAQQLANQGVVVVASFRNPNPHKPGHIAIVRPSDKSDELVAQEGPQLTQAGRNNARSISLKQGFLHHQDAIAHNQIEFFAFLPQAQ